jgi:hypothetical protein
MSSTRSLNDAARVDACRRRVVRHVLCPYCGYEPPAGPPPQSCPKCRGGCWETFARLGKLRPTDVDIDAELDADAHDRPADADVEPAPVPFE